MAKMGLVVDSLQIQSIDDGDSGYISSMAAPHTATIQQAAKIAQAEANRAAAQAEQESARKQAEYERDTVLVRAKYKAETDKAEAEANQAGPLAQAEAEQAVTDKQAELATRQAELRRQQLVAEIVRPAEAEAEKVKTLALANSDATKLEAEAAASNNRVALERMLIEQLPDIVAAAAQGLAGANVSVLNGTDGLSDIVAGLAGQGLSILDVIRGRMSDAGSSADGGAPGAPTSLEQASDSTALSAAGDHEAANDTR
jgi:uncharacterized membrane protein YqiK